MQTPATDSNVRKKQADNPSKIKQQLQSISQKFQNAESFDSAWASFEAPFLKLMNAESLILN